MALSRLNYANRKRLRGEHGFTIIELMVALGMFAVALIAMSVMFTTAFATARGAQNLDAAKQFTQQTFEQMRNVPYFIAFRDQQAGSAPDLLDKYFPALVPTSPANRVLDGVTVQQHYVTDVGGSCPQTSSPPACTFVTTQTGVAGLADSRLTIWLQFVREPDPTTASPSPATAPRVMRPPSDYSSTVADRDAPPSRLVLATLTVNWREGGRVRTFTSDSIIRGTRVTPVKASAKGTTGGGSITSLRWPDGTILSDVLATLGLVTGEIAEADFITSLARGTILEASQVNPLTNELIAADRFLIRPEGAGTAADSRSILGQTSPPVSVSTGAQEIRSTDGLLIARIASGSATAQTQLASPHPGIESEATQSAGGVQLNYRSGATSLAQVNLDSITSRVTVTHTNSQISVEVSSIIDDTDGDNLGIRLWGTHDYDGVPGYQGVVTMRRLEVRINVTANGFAGGASARVRWGWDDFRIWNPTTNSYVNAGSCAFDSNDGPNYPACVGNISIPLAYGTLLPGETPENCTSCSLAITVGATQSAGLPSGLGADALQKNVLNIYFKNQGLRPLENSTFSLGDAAASVTYSRHH